MPRLRDIKSRPLEKAVETAIQEDTLFNPAVYNAAEAERTGFSNYSYWRSTFRVFLKNKIAVLLLIVLVLLVAFTFIQPLLPGQYAANLIVDHPISKLQLRNVPPSTTPVVAKVPEGTELIIAKDMGDGWLAVSSALKSVPRRTALTVDMDAELDGWLHVTHEGVSGYVINDFTTKIKFPDDVSAYPYEITSNFPLTIYLSAERYSESDDELFVHAEEMKVSDDGATGVATTEASLYILPTSKPFLFGTNNIGQDLWALVWSGTRTSLFIGFVVALVEAFVGILVGVLWGYVRRLDRIMTEIYNVIDNIPTTIVLILFSYIMRPGVSTLIFVMCLTGWVGMARFIRNQIVIIRDRDYNLASRCLGTSTFRIISKNLLPYLVSVIMLRMALSIPGAIGNEVFITYIGLGLSPNTPSLGNLINLGRKLVSTSQSYQLLFPTVVLSIVTISFYIIGNAFADAADPKNHI